mmetsp:Transcript_28527/g.43132  ORF Transcript_28527/g.43132 Transcript_28527/m.43132 type:complete len:357 (+) Transcript_28527:225-1295(+)|eukprot:CAMPEP_0178936602 /NCGR_PEP_ID=MMETSP0786-20121207/25272_1 /TAXON_ID=186022 /ORGANISM="Thalassionema frauenfeldii, Strain CCMP 1798" /LENGTH=356 /DNA_ID=CAMNT_0020615039 /DNA_START=75 /DNA_END=1145 /DNA_ORIENTATION=-
MEQQQQQELSLQRVPAELQKRVANFLHYRDAFRLSQVNRQIQESLGMSKIRLPFSSKCTNFKWVGPVRNGDIPRRSISLPLVMQNRVHTIILRGTYHDQGWGDTKGKLYVVASADKARRHRLVAESLSAKHRESPLELEFNTVDDDVTYTLWYKVGSGGSHSLSLNNLALELIMFDEPGFYISKNFHALDSRQALSLQTSFHFHFLLLQKVARVLLDQIEDGDNPDINMTSFMESTGIDMNPKSLLALEQITSSMMEASSANRDAEEGERVAPLQMEEEDVEIRRQCFPWAREEDVPQNNDEQPPRRAVPPGMMDMELEPPPPQGEMLDADVGLFVGMERDMEDMEAMIRRAMQDD